MNNIKMKPGTVVRARYNKLDGYGDRTTGYFCVVYDQQLDPSNDMRNNITALKITTAFSMAASGYCAPLPLNTNKFLSKECMALCDKVYSLSKENVVAILGELDDATYKRVVFFHNKWEEEKKRQLVEHGPIA